MLGAVILQLSPLGDDSEFAFVMLMDKVDGQKVDAMPVMRPLHKVASEAKSRQKKAQKRSAFHRPCFWYGCQ